MLMLASMATTTLGVILFEGNEEQWWRLIQGESSMAHFLLVLAFVFLWKLHRFVGQTLVDDLLCKSKTFLFASKNRDGESCLNLKSNSINHSNHSCPFSVSHDNQIHNRLLPHLKVPPADDLWLQQQIPQATAAERLRFFLASNHEKEAAAKSLQVYLNWRNLFAPARINDNEQAELATNSKEQEEEENDQEIWNLATAMAFRAHGFTKTPMPPSSSSPPPRLPQFVRTYWTNDNGSDNSCYPAKKQYLCDARGARIFHILPGQMDERLCSTATYATALACYLDLKLDRAATERIAVVLDVRGGVGWRNLHAAHQLPFIQHTVTLLLQMFPERLSRAVVYPIPASFVWLWTLASSRCLDAKTRDKIGLVPGTATIQSPLPITQLVDAKVQYMSRSTAERLEQERVAAFVTA